MSSPPTHLDLDDTIQQIHPTTSSSGSRFIFIDAPDGYEIELIERPSGIAFV